MADSTRDNALDELPQVFYYRSETSPERDCPATPIPATPIVFKPQASHLTYNYEPIDDKQKKKMVKSEINKCTRKELKNATQRDMLNLVADVYRGETTDWPSMLAQMTNAEGHTEDKYYDSVSRTWGDWPATDEKNTEVELCDHLNAVADIVRTKLGHKSSEEDLVYSSKFVTKGLISDFTYPRKPDLVVVPRSLQNAAELTFADFRSAVSLKSNPTRSDAKSDEFLQLAEYARVCFAHQRDRRFFIAIGFRHTTLTLFVFDRSGALVSRTYDVHRDPTEFLRIAIGVLFLDAEHLGFDTSFTKEGGECFLRVADETYKITKNIYVDRSIRGRGTVCLKAKRKDGVYVIKSAWVDRSRTIKEAEMLEELKEYKNLKVSQLVAHEVVQVTNRKSRRTRKSRRAWKSRRTVNDNTNIFRRSSMNVEIREHHRIVMQPYGRPLKCFSSLTELLSATLDILDTILFLDNKGILHRDISIGNLVLVVVEGSRLRKGYIIDFDYAIKKDRVGDKQAKGERTGTIPFMAIEILRKCAVHSAIHDAESLFYVLIWIAFIQAGPNGKDRLMTETEFEMSILNSWSPPAQTTDSSLKSIAKGKSNDMEIEEQFVNEILDRMHPYFLAIENCLVLLRRALFPQTNPNLLSIPETILKPGEKLARRTVAVRPARQRNEVFRQMEEALKRGIKELSELEPQLDAQNPTPSTADLAEDGSKVSINYLLSLRHNRMMEDEEDEDNKAQPPEVAADVSVPLASKADSLLVQSLKKSHQKSVSKISKKRSIEDEEEVTVSSRLTKRSRGSTESTASGRTTRSMTSANKEVN